MHAGRWLKLSGRGRWNRQSFVRITLGIAIDGIWSDFEKATQVKVW